MSQCINRKNIFLDFMGPDMWKTMPSFVGSDAYKLKLLSRSLNIAVLLTNDYCILPPAFVAQSHLTRKVMQLKSEFLNEKIVVFPLRESSLEHYFEKKQTEYSYVKDSHYEFYKKRGQTFIKKHADAIVIRKASMGATIAENWKEVSDDSALWIPVISIEPQKADELREIPSLLKGRGISITLEAIKKEAGIQHKHLDFAINQAIQHEYLTTYLDEYNAAIIEDIPPKTLNMNYLIKVENVYYNYFSFNTVLEILGIDEYLKNVSANTINNVRNSIEYIRFLDLYENVCRFYNDRYQVRQYFLNLKARLLVNRSKLPFTYLGLDIKKQFDSLRHLLDIVVDKSVMMPFDKEITTKGKYDNHILSVGRRKMGEKVFVVHGRNIRIRDDIELFIRRIGLEPIILSEQINKGMTIIEKINHYSNVSFAIVLYTPCDEGRLKGEKELNDRARQNVVFEHGYMIAKLGIDNVIALVDKGVEIPGDLDGIVYVSMENNDWKLQVMKELEGAGLHIDWEQA